MLKKIISIVLLCFSSTIVRSQSISVCQGYTVGLCALTSTLTATFSGGTWGSSNAGIATVDGTTIPPTIGGVSTGTAIITYDYNMGCGDLLFSTTVNVNPLPTANPYFDPVCSGGTLALHANPGAIVPSCSTLVYLWQGPSGYSSIASDPTRSPAVAGVYTLTVTNPCSGCASTYTLSVTVGFTIAVNEIAPVLITGDHLFTYVSGMQLQVISTPSLAGYAVTYKWVYSSGGATSTYTSSAPTYTPALSCGVYNYTVSATYGGCAATSLDTIVVPCGTCGSPYDYYNVDTFWMHHYHRLPPSGCTDCATTLPFHTLLSVSLNSSNVADNSNYYIANTTASQKTVFFDKGKYTGDVFYVGKKVVLSVSEHSPYNIDSVTLDSCHFFSSDVTDTCKWWGIQVKVDNSSHFAGHLALIHSTFIENCNQNAGFSAVQTFNTSTYFTPGISDIIRSTGAIFNNNYSGMLIKAYAPSTSFTGVGAKLPFTVVNTIFTDRDLATYDSVAVHATGFYPVAWPGTYALKTITGGTAVNPHFYLDSFKALSNTGGGLNINGCGFDSLQPGTTYNYYRNYVIIGDSSSDPSYRNTNLFDNNVGAWSFTSNTKFYNNTFSALYTATGILSSNATTPTLGYDLQVVGNPAYTNDKNRFYNCALGVSCANTTDLTCTNNWFSADSNSASLVTTAIYADNAFNQNNYTISNNYVENYDYGVQLLNSGAVSYSYRNGTKNVTNNTIVGNTGASYAQNTSAAVNISDARTAFTGGSGGTEGTINVTGNLAVKVRSGIDYNSLTQSGAILQNTVTLINAGGGETGISVAGSPYISQIDNNIISGYGFCYTTTRGISCDSAVGINLTAGTEISCDSVYDLGVGFYFNRTNLLTWKNNVMMRNTIGMDVEGSVGRAGVIGNQGTSSPCIPSDNVWADGASSPTCGTTTWTGWTTTSSSVYQTYGGTHASASSPVIAVRYGTLYNPSVNGGSHAMNITACTPTDSPATCSYGGGGGMMPMHHVPTTLSGLPIGNGIYMLYPNPSDGNIVITRTVADERPVTINVYNAVGQQIYNGQHQFTEGKSSLKLPSNTTPGLYHVRITNAKGQSWDNKVVIEKM